LQKFPLFPQILKYSSRVFVELLSSFEGCSKEAHFIPDLLQKPCEASLDNGSPSTAQKPLTKADTNGQNTSSKT
jgi:hypothetical protein